MSTIPDFQLPSFLSGQDAAEINRRMMEALPAGMDKTEGGFPWDLTMPSALEKAELLEFHLPETLKLTHPMWAYGRWLDYHAMGVGIARKPANAAAGVVRVAGQPGTVIPQGFRFAAPAVGDVPAVEYAAAADTTLDESGAALVEAFALLAGPSGNIPADMVSLMVSPMKGVSSVANPGPMTGGASEESDSELRLRIMDILAAQEASFVGCDADYVRWAREVPGVGAAVVIPEWAGPGTVKLVVTDATGQPANQTILNAVYEYIISPQDRIRRKAPVGAILTVAAPTPKLLDISVTLTLEPGQALETVLERFRQGLSTYYPQAAEDGEVRYTRLAAVLANTQGVRDFRALLVGGARENIRVSVDEYPVTGELRAEVAS